MLVLADEGLIPPFDNNPSVLYHVKTCGLWSMEIGLIGTKEGEELKNELKEIGAIELRVLELVRLNDYPFTIASEHQNSLSA